jgi:hypothetical protein
MTRLKRRTKLWVLKTAPEDDIDNRVCIFHLETVLKRAFIRNTVAKDCGNGVPHPVITCFWIKDPWQVHRNSHCRGVRRSGPNSIFNRRIKREHSVEPTHVKYIEKVSCRPGYPYLTLSTNDLVIG